MHRLEHAWTQTGQCRLCYLEEKAPERMVNKNGHMVDKGVIMTNNDGWSPAVDARRASEVIARKMIAKGKKKAARQQAQATTAEIQKVGPDNLGKHLVALDEAVRPDSLVVPGDNVP